MPNPKNYQSKRKFMSVCVKKLKSEGKASKDARDQCYAMWIEEHGEKDEDTNN